MIYVRVFRNEYGWAEDEIYYCSARCADSDPRYTSSCLEAHRVPHGEKCFRCGCPLVPIPVEAA